MMTRYWESGEEGGRGKKGKKGGKKQKKKNPLGFKKPRTYTNSHIMSVVVIPIVNGTFFQFAVIDENKIPIVKGITSILNDGWPNYNRTMVDEIVTGTRIFDLYDFNISRSEGYRID